MDKQLIYVGDPMCSWCWGFSPIKRALEEQARGRAELIFVAGGLRPGTTEAMDEERKSFLRHHWADVGTRTGQPFAFTILERDDFVYDTEIPCRAAVTARHLDGNETALEFFAQLQHAFYAENRDVTEPEVLTGLATAVGLDAGAFAEAFASDEMKAATIADFQFAQSLGVTGFPTVVAKDESGYAYLTLGYQPYENLRDLFEAWLDGKAAERQAPAAE